MVIAIFLYPFFIIPDYLLLIKIDQIDSLILSNILNIHFFILLIFQKFLEIFSFNNLLILRLVNLFYISLIIFISYKIIKIKFYDLNIWSPLTTIFISGIVIFSLMTIQNYLASALVSLVTFYFLLKIFEEDKFINNILFTFFSLITMLMNNFFFLIIVTLYSTIKLINFKLQNEKKLNFISNLSLIYILAVSLIIIQQINYENFLFELNTSFDEITERIKKIVILFLPLFGIFFISLFFNIFKKINWNKDLLLFLLIILISLLAFIFSKQLNYKYLVFSLPFFVIYTYRTLEFVNLRFSKFPYIFMFFLPILIIFFDTSFYLEMEDIPLSNYIFYISIILISLINPIFVIQNQSIIDVQKIATYSFLTLISVSSFFLYYQYNKLLIQNIIPSVLLEEFGCNINSSKFTVTKINDDFKFYFSKNLRLDNNQSCHFELNFTSLNDVPINDINSVNKTILDMSLKTFLNLNFKQL